MIFFKLLSLLPFWLLNLLSKLVYVLVYYIIGYRKKVVRNNLQNSFPNKTKQDLISIEKKFYKHFSSLFFETIKTLSLSKQTMQQRCYFSVSANNLFKKYYNQNQSIILVMGHLGNWEWAGNAVAVHTNYHVWAIYHPIENKFFDKLMKKLRTRFGSNLVAMNNTFKVMLNNKQSLTATGFIADQTPLPHNAYWTTFLNQPTPVFWGTEKMACRFNYPVIYLSMKKIAFGRYEIDATLLTETPASTAIGEISEMHTKQLEKDIVQHPEMWLWSHRRWKHKQPI